MDEWTIDAEATLRKVSKFFRARATMYAALYGNNYDKERLPTIALEVEELLSRKERPPEEVPSVVAV